MRLLLFLHCSCCVAGTASGQALLPVLYFCHAAVLYLLLFLLMRSCYFVAVLLLLQNTLINRCLVAYGTEQQQRTYLPQLCQREFYYLAVPRWALQEDGSPVRCLSQSRTLYNHKNVKSRISVRPWKKDHPYLRRREIA